MPRNWTWLEMTADLQLRSCSTFEPVPRLGLKCLVNSAIHCLGQPQLLETLLSGHNSEKQQLYTIAMSLYYTSNGERKYDSL